MPIGLQLGLVEFSQSFHKTKLPLGQRACDQADGINAEDPDFALIIRVEMSHVMWGANFGKHANDNTQEPAEFRH